MEGCLTTPLPHYTSQFLPESLVEQYDPDRFLAFASTHVRRWIDNRFRIFITWSEFFPSITAEVTEFEAVGSPHRFSSQYRLNLATNQPEVVQIPSLPLGLQPMNVAEWRVALDEYLEQLLRESSSLIPDVCFDGDDCTVASDFLRSLLKFRQAVTGDAGRVSPSAVDVCRPLTVLSYRHLYSST